MKKELLIAYQPATCVHLMPAWTSSGQHFRDLCVVCRDKLCHLAQQVHALLHGVQVVAREYKSFMEFVDDFKLMCNNAMVYNQKRSRVHKTAVTMLRAGIKQLQHIEVDACKELGCPVPAAPALQQPAVPAAAAADLSQPLLSDSARADQALPGVALSPAKPSKPPPKAPPAKPPPKKVSKVSPPNKGRSGPQKPPKGDAAAWQHNAMLSDSPALVDPCGVKVSARPSYLTAMVLHSRLMRRLVS